MSILVKLMKMILAIIGFPIFCYKAYKWIRHIDYRLNGIDDSIDNIDNIDNIDYKFANMNSDQKKDVSRKVLEWIAKENQSKYPSLAVLSNDYIGREVQIDGFYDNASLEIFIKWLQDNNFSFNGIALDVGANLGNHSVFFSQYFDYTMSFEPNKNLYYLLQYNATLGKNITTYNVGVSEVNEEAYIYANGGSNGFVTHVKQTSSNTNSSVDLVNLDSFLNYSKPIKFIKVDIEGYELLGFKGMKTILNDNKPLLYFEQIYNEWDNGKNKVMEYLNGLGYEKFGYIEGGAIIFGNMDNIPIPVVNINIIAIHKDNESAYK